MRHHSILMKYLGKCRQNLKCISDRKKMNTGTTYQYVGMTLLKNLCIGNPLVERERVWFLIGKVLKLHWVQASIKRVLTAR